MPAIMRRFRKGNTFGTETIKLVMPTEYKAKRFVAKTWHNPYTEQDEVRKEKERMKRESLFSYDNLRRGRKQARQGGPERRSTSQRRPYLCMVQESIPPMGSTG